MMALLGWTSLRLILRHTTSTILLTHGLLSRRRLLTLTALASYQLVEIHEVLELRNSLKKLLDAVRHRVHLLLLLLLLLLMVLALSARLLVMHVKSCLLQSYCTFRGLIIFALSSSYFKFKIF